MVVKVSDSFLIYRPDVPSHGGWLLSTDRGPFRQIQPSMK